MIKTLLFDLDDTLLGNDMGTFLPRYFELMVQHFGRQADAQSFIAQVVASTRAMLSDDDPTRSLRSHFNHSFYTARGEAEADWAPRWESFYRAAFPALQSVTSLRPTARPLMEWAFAQGYEVVIATSPLFPLLAIQERLRWAGVADFAYRRITSFENSHFAKPHPEYFAEILAHLGRRPEEVLVVGNDWVDDMLPAAALGAPHYWIAPVGSQPPHSPSGTARPLEIGDLESFFTWARTALPEVRPPAPPAGSLPFQLTGVLCAIAGLLEDLPEAAWSRRPASGDWSPAEILCHLRDVEQEVYLPRLQSILTQDNPFFTATDTDLWASARGYASASGPAAWQAYAAARQQTRRLLRGLPTHAWRRPARHAIIGPTHLTELAGLMLDHDYQHLEQLRQAREHALTV